MIYGQDPACPRCQRGYVPYGFGAELNVGEACDGASIPFVCDHSACMQHGTFFTMFTMPVRHDRQLPLNTNRRVHGAALQH